MSEILITENFYMKQKRNKKVKHTAVLLTEVCFVSVLNCKSNTCESLCLDDGSSSTVRPKVSGFASGLGIFIKASMSPMQGIYSGMNGFSLNSSSIACG